MDATLEQEAIPEGSAAPGQVLRRHLVTDIPRFERPSGRAPKGKEWDFQTGKWQSKTREKTREEAEEKSVSDAAARPTAELVTEADGLRLHLACTRYPSRTGYKGVSYHPTASKKKPFCVVVRPEGTGLAQHVGYFATPVEAAVAYARVMALHGRTVEDLRQEAFDALQRSLGRPVEPVRSRGMPEPSGPKRKRADFDFKGKSRAEVSGARITVWYEEELNGRKVDVPYQGVVNSCDPREGLYVKFEGFPEEMLITNEDDWRWGSHQRKPPEGTSTGRAAGSR